MAYQKQTPRVAVGGNVPFESPNLNDALRQSLAVDLADPEVSFTLWISDIHFQAQGPLTSKFDVGIEQEFLNLAANPPESVVVGGDVMTSYVTSFGFGPYLVYGNPEMAKANAEMPKLARLAPLRTILGNHDTGPNESPFDSFVLANANWYEQPHHSWVSGGVHCCALSTTHDADLKKSGGELYLKNFIAALPDTNEVIIFIHQPSLGARVIEYGMRESLQAAIPETTTNLITVIGGHQHIFADALYTHGATTIHQWTVGPASSVVFNTDSSSPVMAAVIKKAGQIIARVVFNGNSCQWTVLDDYSRANPAVMVNQLDGIDGALQTFYQQGSFTNADHIETPSGDDWRDTGSWLASVDDMEVHFPMGALADTFFVSASAIPTGAQMSADGDTWEDVTESLYDSNIVSFAIPVDLQAQPVLHFKATWSNAYIGGWGFSTS